MKWRTVMWCGIGAAVPSLGGLAIWIASLPKASPPYAPSAVGPEEVDAILAALRPPKRKRPLVAVIGLNKATETTDYILPTGILRRADVADVITVATSPGPVTLFPALTIQPDTTIARFDAQHPGGADYVIVPAMSRDDDPQVMEWLKRQAASRAIIVAVCAGAKVVAAAGLLDGSKATTHWCYVKELFERHPAARHVPDRRFVVDRGIATTTGITASMPMILTLIETIGGRAKAEATAANLGIERWGVEHSSGAFGLTRRFVMAVLRNKLAFWSRERFGLELRPGFDEVSLALVADAWSRTYRSSAFTFAVTANAIESRNGMRVVPDRVVSQGHKSQRLPPLEGLRPSSALNGALAAIANRYGPATAEVVSIQLKYTQRSVDNRRRVRLRTDLNGETDKCPNMLFASRPAEDL